MPTSREKVLEYSQMEHVMPAGAQGMGAAQDAKGRFVMVGFNTRREIVTEIGYLASDAGSPILHACMNALCELVKDKAVMNAKLPQREAIAALLSDDGALDEEDAPFAVLAELALHYAVHNYANTRTGVTL